MAVNNAVRMALCKECSPAAQCRRSRVQFPDALCRGCRWPWSSPYICLHLPHTERRKAKKRRMRINHYCHYDSKKHGNPYFYCAMPFPFLLTPLGPLPQGSDLRDIRVFHDINSLQTYTFYPKCRFFTMFRRTRWKSQKEKTNKF